MAEETRDLTFNEELYASIAVLGFWDDDKVGATSEGVAFQIDNISAVEEFTGVGSVKIDNRDSEEELAVDYLTLNIILAQDAPDDKKDLIAQRLYEVNLGLKEGMFFIDDEKNLVYEVNFPILRGKVEESLELFIAMYIDAVNYIDGVYPYLLRVIAKPDDCNFNEYIVAMAGEEETTEEKTE